MTIAAGQPALATDVISGLAGAVTSATNIVTSGKFYADTGASVVRYGDRLFVGAATDNQGLTNRNLTSDWLSAAMASTTVGAWPVWGATFASLSRFGGIGSLSASRTSDASANTGLLGYTPSTIGGADWAIDDDTSSPRTTTAYGRYIEVWRRPGVTYQPAFGIEVEGVEFGAEHVGSPNPYQANVGGGVSAVQLGSGGGQTAASVTNIASFVTMVSNPVSAQVGLVFGATSIAGTTGASGDSGYGAAIALARNQAIQWHTPDGNVCMFIRSTATAASNATRIEGQDSGAVISNASGQPVFAAHTTAAATNYLYTQAGSGSQAAGIYVAEGAGGSPNIGLFPASGGEIVTTSPAVTPGNTIPANIQPAGWMHINLNGADVRIPYFTPTQAGG